MVLRTIPFDLYSKGAYLLLSCTQLVVDGGHVSTALDDRQAIRERVENGQTEPYDHSQDTDVENTFDW